MEQPRDTALVITAATEAYAECEQRIEYPSDADYEEAIRAVLDEGFAVKVTAGVVSIRLPIPLDTIHIEMMK